MKDIDLIITDEIVNYADSIRLMEKRVSEIYKGKEKELIWFLNHNNIYTQGVNSSEDEIISKKNNIPIIKTNRGGKTTYHGPGQRIVYFLIDLNKRKKDIRKFISLIEVSVIKFLKHYDIEAKTFEDRVGIWVTKNKNNYLKKEEKIGAIGLRLRKWITYHGLSFNINPDLTYYDSIQACGLKNYNNTSLKKLNIEITKKEFDNEFINIFLKDIENL